MIKASDIGGNDKCCRQIWMRMKSFFLSVESIHLFLGTNHHQDPCLSHGCHNKGHWLQNSGLLEEDWVAPKSQCVVVVDLRQSHVVPWGGLWPLQKRKKKSIKVCKKIDWAPPMLDIRPPHISTILTALVLGLYSFSWKPLVLGLYPHSFSFKPLFSQLKAFSFRPLFSQL